MSSTEVENLFFEEIKSRTPHIEKIEVMLESGLVDLEAKNKRGKTPLHWASYNDSIAIAKLLLERGADVGAKDEYGQTPLHYASANNYIELAKLLIDAGADVEATDKWERTPLNVAGSDKMRALLGGGL
jgi:ankyrin repeat protein